MVIHKTKSLLLSNASSLDTILKTSIKLHITHNHYLSPAQPKLLQLLTLNVTSTLLLGYMLSHLESSIHRITAKTI